MITNSEVLLNDQPLVFYDTGNDGDEWGRGEGTVYTRVTAQPVVRSNCFS